MMNQEQPMTPEQPASGQKQPDQELFDNILAKGMKMIYADGVSDKIAETVGKTDPAIGVKTMTDAIMKKMGDAAMKAGSRIPQDMLPDLTLAIASQVADISKASNIEVSEEDVTKAFQNIVAEKTAQGLKDGSIDKGEAAQGAEMLQQKMGTQAQPQPMQQEEPMPVQQPPQDPFNPRSTMTQKLEGGLL